MFNNYFHSSKCTVHFLHPLQVVWYKFKYTRVYKSKYTHLNIPAFVYSITYLNTDLKLKSQLRIANSTYKGIRTLLWDDGLHQKLWVRMMKFYVCPTLLYGVEAWTLKAAAIKRVTALELLLPKKFPGLYMALMNRVWGEQTTRENYR